MFEITTAPGIRLRGSKDKYGEENIKCDKCALKGKVKFIQ